MRGWRRLKRRRGARYRIVRRRRQWLLRVHEHKLTQPWKEVPQVCMRVMAIHRKYILHEPFKKRNDIWLLINVYTWSRHYTLWWACVLWRRHFGNWIHCTLVATIYIYKSKKYIITTSSCNIFMQKSVYRLFSNRREKEEEEEVQRWQGWR